MAGANVVMTKERERRVRGRRRGAEDGYVLVMFALLLVSLLAFAGFGVDVGAWYSRGQQIQRAVDAAALAGVVYLPADVPQAQTVACATLKKNGIDCADTTNFEVSISPVGDRQLKVIARDKRVETHFSKVLMDELPNGIRRESIAEYVLPVPLGSPESRLGTGDLTWTSLTPQYFWASVSAFCTPKEKGDQISSWTDGQDEGPCPPPHGNGIGDPTAPQPTYSATGYDYYIKIVPSNPGIAVRIYDSGFCPNSAPGDLAYHRDPVTGQDVNDTPFSTEYRLYWADSTPLDDGDNPQFGSTVTRGLNQNCAAWNTLWNIPASTTPGLWRLNVRTQPNVNVSGHNNFSIWARRSGIESRPCNSLTAATCPQVYAKERMSITANRDASSATFYLAEVAPLHVGKHLEVQLWDAGDGMNNLQILNPSGTPQPFRYRTTGESNDYAWTNNDTCSGQPCLRVDGTGPSPSNKPNRVSNRKYNDRLLVLDVTLPNSFSGFPNNWWRIRYTPPSGNSVFDRTTWSAVVRGDPVHLVNE